MKEVNETEIRIGNIFKHKATWSYRNRDEKELVFAWNAYDWYGIGESTIDLDDVEPIPLTEKVLLACGFEPFNKTEYETGYTIDDLEPSKRIYIRTAVIKNIGFFSVFNYSSCGGNEIQFITQLDYLHQLQNLIYSLKGEELKVNIDEL